MRTPIINERIKPETAIIAKDLGFDEYCDQWYEIAKKDIIEYDSTKIQFEKGEVIDAAMRNYNSQNTDNNNWRICSAPNQSLLQRWLREKYNLHVRVDISLNVFEENWYFEVQKIPVGVTYMVSESTPFFNSYEEAMEAGLLTALKQIKL